MDNAINNGDLPVLKTELLARFKCQQSGNCCRREGYVYVTPQEMSDMAKFLGVALAEFQKKYVIREEGWSLISSPTHRDGCFLNQSNQCSIYPVRPKECKTYPNWESIWQTKEGVLAELAMCPGLKKAFVAYQSTLTDRP